MLLLPSVGTQVSTASPSAAESVPFVSVRATALRSLPSA